jgi:hypothetical protein
MEATPSAHVFSTTSSHILHRRNPSTSTLRRHDYINDLHCIKPEINDSNINVKLYDYIKIFVEFYIANINVTKVYIHAVFRHRRQKPAAARDLRSPPPPTTKTRRRRRSAAAAAYDKTPPPPQNRCRRRRTTAAAA